MINNLVTRYNRHKVLIENFNFMAVFQLSRILFPLLIYPYLIRVLGKETYGMIAFANAFIAYLIILINFGFNISEITDISVNRDNKEKLCSIISSVIIIRFILLIISFLIIFLTWFTIPVFSHHKLLYMCYSGILIGTALDLSFYFQGIEKMKYITFISFFSNCILLLLVLLFVKNSSHYLLVPLFTSIGMLISTLSGLYIVFWRNKIKFKLQPFNRLKYYMRESLPFFSSRISDTVIDKSNILLIGSFIGLKEVAYYDLASKLVMALKAPFQIFNQALFPNVSRTKNIKLVIKTLKFLIIFYVMAYVLLFIFADPAINIIAGKALLPSKYILYILGITIITELVSTFLGAPMLLISGFKNEYNKSIIYGCLFYIFIITTLFITGFITTYLLASATVFTGSFILFYRLYFCRHHKLI